MFHGSSVEIAGDCWVWWHTHTHSDLNLYITYCQVSVYRYNPWDSKVPESRPYIHVVLMFPFHSIGFFPFYFLRHTSVVRRFQPSPPPKKATPSDLLCIFLHRTFVFCWRWFGNFLFVSHPSRCCLIVSTTNCKLQKQGWSQLRNEEETAKFIVAWSARGLFFSSDFWVEPVVLGGFVEVLSWVMWVTVRPKRQQLWKPGFWRKVTDIWQLF